MRVSSSQGWWIDKAGTKPTHTVTKVEPHPDGEAGVLAVTMTNNTNGDEITTKFNPGHTIKSWAWDPTIMPPPPAAGAFNLGGLAQAQGWKKLTGDGGIAWIEGGPYGKGVLTVEPGQAVSISNAAIDHTTGGRHVLRKVSQDGVVIEVIDADNVSGRNSVYGVTAITLPDGATEQQLAGAMADLGINYSPMTRGGAQQQVRGILRSLLSFDVADQETAKGWSDQKLFTEAGSVFGIPDLGWHDVSVGTDENSGKVTFWWSPRVLAAIEQKSHANLVIRGGHGHQGAKSIVHNAIYGGAGGVLRRVTGMGRGGISEGQDSGNMAGAGSFTSITNATGTLPKHNPYWSSFHGYTVYHRSSAIFGRIQDFRTGPHSGYNQDAFGKPAQGTNSLHDALTYDGIKDFYVGGGTPAESIAFIGVQTSATRTQAIAELHQLGYTTIGGRPIEEVVLLQSDIGQMTASDLPPAVPPANARNILNLPETYAGEEPPAPAMAEVVAAA
jgi:hypothetical protein